jgi:hypothetical protein
VYIIIIFIYIQIANSEMFSGVIDAIKSGFGVSSLRDNPNDLPIYGQDKLDDPIDKKSERSVTYVAKKVSLMDEPFGFSQRDESKVSSHGDEPDDFSSISDKDDKVKRKNSNIDSSHSESTSKKYDAFIFDSSDIDESLMKKSDTNYEKRQKPMENTNHPQSDSQKDQSIGLSQKDENKNDNDEIEPTCMENIELLFRKKLQCVYCNSTFSLYNTIGMRQCSFHRKNFNSVHDGDVFLKNHYDCCGTSKTGEDRYHYDVNLVRGCIMSDHTASTFGN